MNEQQLEMLKAYLVGCTRGSRVDSEFYQGYKECAETVLKEIDFILNLEKE